MNVRKAKINDLKEIDEIYREGILDEEKNKPSRKSKKQVLLDLNNSKKNRLNEFRKSIHSPKERFLICEEDGKIIGFGDVVLSRKNKDAEVALVYVRRGYRGKGVGKKLLKELLKWLKEKNEDKVYVTMDVTNNASIKLHKREGFKESAIFMQKKLRLK